MLRRRRIVWALVACLWLVGAAGAQEREVVVLTADGPVTPALALYIERGLREAGRRGAEALVLELNTPGGQVDTMLDIVEAIRASSVPVVVFITPRGAIAGSAGTVITLAGHAAAMSPETAIGAASPVGGQGEDLDETLTEKVKQILRAQVRTLASRRRPEAVAFAESTIEEAKAASAREAFEIGMVDFIADDTDDLLRQLEGFAVQVQEGERALHTAGAVPVRLPMNLVEQFLLALTNPNIVFLLMTIGAQAILIELSSPGGWVAGFIGVVCLALALYGLGVLPVNWFGLIFIILAFVLFVLDIKAPTHGALTAAGIASLIAGALTLFNSPGAAPFERVNVALVVSVSLAMAAFFAFVLTKALRAQLRPAAMGMESLIGEIASVREALNPSGTVHVRGELWTAEADGETVMPGAQVEVVGVRGLRLRVKPRAAGQLPSEPQS